MIYLRDRILAYFARHPDEDITTAYAAARWGVPKVTASKTLRQMRGDGLLQTRDSRSGIPLVYEPTETLRSLHAGR